MKYLLWDNFETKVSYCIDWMVMDKCFQNMTEKGFENGKLKQKCVDEDWYFEGTF